LDEWRHGTASWRSPDACGLAGTDLLRGVAVFPDDIVIADADGVVIIPAGLADEVASKGSEQERIDEWQLAQINRGVSLSELTPMPEGNLKTTAKH